MSSKLDQRLVDEIRQMALGAGFDPPTFAAGFETGILLALSSPSLGRRITESTRTLVHQYTTEECAELVAETVGPFEGILAQEVTA